MQLTAGYLQKYIYRKTKYYRGKIKGDIVSGTLLQKSLNQKSVTIVVA